MRKFLIYSSILLCILASSITNSHYSARAEETYNVESFSEVPSDWTLFDQSDIGSTTTNVQDGVLQIRHANTSVTSKQYYGSLYQIGNFDYADFTFEITFKMTNAANSVRWMSVIYHSKLEENNLVGYMTAYRYDGEVYSSAITKERTFLNDSAEKAAGLSDGEYHTLKIVMEGNICSQYVDGGLIQEWNVTSKTTKLGETLTSGGFGLIVNQSMVSIKSLSIKDYAEEDTYVVDNDIVNTYTLNTSLVNAPTVVCDVVDRATLDLLKSNVLPSNAILRVNSQLEVIAKDSQVLGSFDEIYTTIIKGRMIPILRIDDQATVDAFLDYFATIRDILDIAMISKDPSLIKAMKESNSKMRGIIEFSEATTAYDIVKTLNMNYANVALLPEALATQEIITAIQARLKTVWTALETADDISIYNAISSGTYGIVTSQFSNVYSVYGTFNQPTYARSTFNVAHRGLPKSYNENSVGGIKAAIAGGATHVEVDGYLTTDGEIAIMHDGTIDRTSNGSGSIETMSSTDLAQYQLDLVQPYESIPLLQDIIQEVKKTDAVLVFEIKSGKAELIDRFRELLLQYDFFDQCVAISFSLPMLKLMKERIPEIPTANLNAATVASFPSVLKWMGEYNTGIDTSGSGNRTFNEYYLRDRGIVGWFWTFNESGDVDYAHNLGLMGITNNCADYSGDQIRFVHGVLGQKANLLAVGMKVAIDATTYKGEVIRKEGTIIKLVETSSQYLVVARYEESSYPLITEAFAIEKDASEPGPGNGDHSSATDTSSSGTTNESKNNSLVLTIVLGSIVGVSLIGLVIYYLKGRRLRS